MQTILKNTIYYGPFIWSGRLLNGKHEPLLGKALFDKVQETMGYRKHQTVTKKNFVFGGLMTCGHCGCSIVGEEKRKKSGRRYTYYHCTKGSGTCDHVVYMKEESLEEQFAEILKAIEIPESIVEWTRDALLESSKQEQSVHEATRKSLSQRYEKLQAYIDRAYTDKLEGTLEPEEWTRRTAEWKQEQADVLSKLNAYKQANTTYIEDGVKLMSIAARAAELFGKMTKEEKRETLKLILSNPRLLNGSIEYDYKKPFDQFVNVTNLEEWRGRRELNHCVSSNVLFPDKLGFKHNPELPAYKERSFLHQKYVVEKLSIAQIASQSFSSKPTIRKALIEAGIPLRQPHHHHGRTHQMSYGVKKLGGQIELPFIRTTCDSCHSWFKDSGPQPKANRHISFANGRAYKVQGNQVAPDDGESYFAKCSFLPAQCAGATKCHTAIDFMESVARGSISGVIFSRLLRIVAKTEVASRVLLPKVLAYPGHGIEPPFQ
jgi:hypothetical protein